MKRQGFTIKELLSVILLTFVSYSALVSFIPQIHHLIKTKNAQGISKTSWLIWTVSAICYTTYTVINWDLLLFLSGAIKLTCNIIITVLVFKYSINTNEQNNLEARQEI